MQTEFILMQLMELIMLKLLANVLHGQLSGPSGDERLEARETVGIGSPAGLGAGLRSGEHGRTIGYPAGLHGQLPRDGPARPETSGLLRHWTRPGRAGLAGSFRSPRTTCPQGRS